jgi:hypothetical protein
MTTALIVLTFVQGLAAGICFDVATVKLPTRHRIGTLAYAQFALGNDLGNGLKVYPFLVVGGGVALIAMTITAYTAGQPSELMNPLYIASLSAVGYLAATAKAAPIMWSLRTTSDDEQLVARKLDRFAYWHTWRTVFQLTAFGALLRALA